MSGSETFKHTPTKSQPLGGYWRVPVFALVGALLAFTFSFAFKSQYPSASRMIIRTGETSYASTDSAASLGGDINIGGIDLTKQQTLGNTLVNLAQSRQSAAEIVERIGVDRVLDGKEPSKGIVSKVVDFIKVGSPGEAPSKRDAAIDAVQGSIEAAVLDESWVMEITAWNPNADLAREISDTAADVVVDQSAQRFKENSLRELDYLTGELARGREDVAKKAQAVADFKTANGIIMDTSGESLASALAPSAPANLDQLNSQLVGLRARQQVLRERLAATPRTITVNSTNPDGSPARVQQPNPEYTATEAQLESVQGDIAVAEAQFNDLAGRLGGGSVPGVNSLQVQLSQLQSDLELAQANYETLNQRFTAVSATVEKPRFDASRLGEASNPTAPGRPLRYLFLLVGALVGALAGLLLTWFRIIREEDEEGSDHDEHEGSVGDPFGPPTTFTMDDDFIVDVRQPVRADADAEPKPVRQMSRTADPVGNGGLSAQEAAGLASRLFQLRPSGGAQA